MIKKLLILFLFILSCSFSFCSINWHDNWAFGCDNSKEYFKTVSSRGTDCGSECHLTYGCTNYVWKDGICHLKSGDISKEDFFENNDIDAICGICPSVKKNYKKQFNNQMLVSELEFINAVTANGYPRPTTSQYNSYVNQLKSRGGIDTKREAAMFLTHCIHESGGLIYKRELACVDTGCPGVYGTSKYQGKSYYGRGYLQLSWNYNYEAASSDLFGDDRLLSNPDQVADNEDYSWATAFWFWRKNVGVNADVKKGYFGAGTKIINGGLECWKGADGLAKVRFNKYKVVLKQFNINEQPIETGCYN